MILASHLVTVGMKILQLALAAAGRLLRNLLSIEILRAGTSAILHSKT